MKHPAFRAGMTISTDESSMVQLVPYHISRASKLRPNRQIVPISEIARVQLLTRRVVEGRTHQIVDAHAKTKVCSHDDKFSHASELAATWLFSFDSLVMPNSIVPEKSTVVAAMTYRFLRTF